MILADPIDACAAVLNNAEVRAWIWVGFVFVMWAWVWVRLGC